jgi:cell division septation protein DedD
VARDWSRIVLAVFAAAMLGACADDTSQRADATAASIGDSAANRVKGQYLVQLAAARTEEEAEALATKAKRDHGPDLAARGQSIDQAVLGGMGAFYLVRFGPFASARETQAVCTRLQGSGIDCVPINP